FSVSLGGGGHRRSTRVCYQDSWIFNVGTGSPHAVLSPDKNREHSITFQWRVWNMKFIRYL
ncbi:hypothetical protein, partial [Pseudomonas syringae]|uniref:hypothetical protein n=1 Tax=Pseudomonas syringae TaxID=317 RepID=UPI001C816D41